MYINKSSRIKQFVFFLLFVPLIGSSQKANLKKLDKYFQTSLTAWNIPGMSIGIVKDDSMVFAKGYGVRDVTTKEPVDEHTLFAIASNSKSFTSASLAVLVDEGKLKWDDKVVDFLPYFKLYDPYVTQSMTIRDLLSHRSGLKTFSGDLIWYGSSHSREEVIRRARFLKPNYSYRTEFGYSNIMYLAAGEIIPKIENKSWDDFVKARFFEPLGMTRTITSVKDVKSMDNIAMPHNNIDGVNINIGYLDWDNIGPAGSIISSARDMSQWLKLHLNDGLLNKEAIISEEQIREMRHPHVNKRVGAGSESLWPTKHFSAYGLGWDLFDYNGYKVVTHGGGYDGMISQTVMVPELNLGFVVLTNNLNSLPYALMFSVLDEYTGMVEKQDWADLFLEFEKSGKEAEEREEYSNKQKRVPNTKPSLPLGQYVGTYYGEMYGKAEVKQINGKLEVQFLPSSIFHGKLEHWHYDTFTVEMTAVPSLKKGKCSFVIDSQGEVEEMRIDIPNPDFDFTELEFKKIN